MKFLDYLLEDNRNHPSMKKKYNKSKSKAPLKPKPRPKTNLWFENPDFWKEDLRMEKGDGVKYKKMKNKICMLLT